MEKFNRTVIGSENGNSLVAKPAYSFSERIIYPIKGLYHILEGACHTVAEHTKKAGYATIDRLVSEYKTRKDDATLLPFDYSNGMNYGSLSDKVYNHLQGILGSASKRVCNLINPYSGLSGHYSTVKAREHTQSKHKKGGFTLTELLVTISATALLMAILMPSLQRARNQAKAVVCQSNLHQWGLKFATVEGTPSLYLLWLHGPNWESFYDEPKGVILCPMAKKLGPQISPTWWIGSKFSAWGRKSNNHEPFACSYGLNYRLESQFIKSGSSVPVLFDCTDLMNSLWSSHNLPPKYDDMSVLDANVDEYPGSSICINRHDGGIEMLFLDGSVRKVGLKELWTLKWHRDFDTAGPWTKAGGVKPEDWPKWMRNFKDY